MEAYLQSTAKYFGFPRLRLDLDEESPKRIICVTILPALALTASLVGIALEIVFKNHVLTAAEFWVRLYFISNSIEPAFLPLGLAVLFVASLREWSYAEVSWMFVIGISLAGVAAGLAVTAVIMYALFGLEEAFDLRAGSWAFLARVPGFLAVGYLFLAYRSANFKKVHAQASALEEGERQRS